MKEALFIQGTEGKSKKGKGVSGQRSVKDQSREKDKLMCSQQVPEGDLHGTTEAAASP